MRQLCTAGCDIDAVTENGFTADEVAANCSHDELATLIHHLRQVRYMTVCLTECFIECGALVVYNLHCLSREYKGILNDACFSC